MLASSFFLSISHPCANRLSRSCTCGCITRAYSRARPRVPGYAAPVRTRANACTRVYLSRSPPGLKRHAAALDKTSGLASPRANYPHLFLGHVRKRAARTSSSRRRRAAAAVAAAAADAACARSRNCLSRCSAGHDFSGLTHDRFHR